METVNNNGRPQTEDREKDFFPETNDYPELEEKLILKGEKTDMSSNKKNNNRGFSLVELIVVVAIGAILIGASILSIASISGTAAKQCARNIESILNKTKVTTMGKDTAANTVTIGEEADLYTDSFTVRELNWISIPELSAPMRVKARTRYRQTEQWATIYPEGRDRLRLEFDRPQRALTVGQALVLYDGETVVGGGTISQVP